MWCLDFDFNFDCINSLTFFSHVTGFKITERHRRSTDLFVQGVQASRKLLAGARILPREGRLKRFEKIGNINTAMREFYSVKPREVNWQKLDNGVNVISGLVGDRQIVMIDNGVRGNAMIRIIDNKAKRILEEWNQPGTYGDQIIYRQ